MTYVYIKELGNFVWSAQQQFGRDNFSYKGAQALSDYIENLAEDTGEPIEFDFIAWCCDCGEYTLEEYNYYHDTNYTDANDIDSSEHSIFIVVDSDTVICSNF